MINNFIRAKEVRVIDETGKQIGVMNVFDAINLAKSRGLDLIQVTERVEPPICKISDSGKYLYSLKKKEKKAALKSKTELKEVRIGFNTSPHDIEVRAKQSEKFLKEGHKVKASMVLRGREKSMGDMAKGKMKFFLETVERLVPIKTEREIKREPRGFTMIISKK